MSRSAMNISTTTGVGGGASEEDKSRKQSTGVKPKPGVGGAEHKGNNQVTTIRLPKCPEGQTMTSGGVPCERRSQGRKGVRRKPGFRVPLKKEDGNMEAQIIEYNCEFPNRVVVRLEYLMQTTKVRLNDRHYMDDFYEKLLEEERIALIKATRQRERAEQNRMKMLIIEGVNKDIPPELAYLHKHPVFRVNQMLGRLKSYDTNFTTNTMEEEITAVEPYEFNGNQFFKHLHDTGELWMPSEQKLFEEEKLEGKIYRAKLRLLQKRKEMAAEENILRVLNNVEEQRRQAEMEAESEMMGGEEGDFRPPQPKPNKEAPDWLSQYGSNVTNDEDEKLNKALKINTVTQPFSIADRAVDKIKTDAHKEVGRLSEKIRRSKEIEKEHEALLDIKRHEQESHYLDTFNYDKARILINYDRRQKRGQVDELLNRPDHKTKSAQKVSDGKPKPYEKIFQKDIEEKDIRHSTKFGKEPLFLKLRKIYGVGNTYPFHHYEDYDNELVLDYLDSAQDGQEMMEFGENVTEMYTRQLMVADDHLKKRQNTLQQTKLKLQQYHEEE